MPITVRPSDHPSSPWAGRRYRHASSPDILLHYTLTDDSRPASPPRARKLLQSSFARLQRRDNLFATKHGFVHACLEAYNEHHGLVVRPEDVWLAILTQFSAYVNGRSAELRTLFCNTDDRRELHIDLDLTAAAGVDHGRVAHAMTKLLQENIKDEGLRDWVQPAFTTTTKVDQAVASVVFLGTMQKYFTYSWGTRCGIPTVTLLGEAHDWAKIRERADRLSTYGSEPQRWLDLLKPVLDGFVASFEEPEGVSARRFWQGICDEHVPNGSGSVTYSGWITAFCFWDEGGRCLHGPPPPTTKTTAAATKAQPVRLTRSQLPSGFTRVPVTLLHDGVPTPTEMVAGSVAIKAFRGYEIVGIGGADGQMQQIRRNAANDTIQPELGWFMFKT